LSLSFLYYFFLSIRNLSQVLVAHTCNPSYSGGRDQEDCGSKPTLGKWFSRPHLKKSHHKKGLVEWLKVKALSSSPSTAERKKERKKEGRKEEKKCNLLLYVPQSELSTILHRNNTIEQQNNQKSGNWIPERWSRATNNELEMKET
jgi:hypothetical protein